MTTCADHQWNVPCPVCAQHARHDTERLNRIWRLGHTLSHAPSQKAIAVRTERRPFVIRTPRGLVPEVDPVTREATGRAKQFVIADGSFSDADAGVHDGVLDVNYVSYR